MNAGNCTSRTTLAEDVGGLPPPILSEDWFAHFPTWMQNPLQHTYPSSERTYVTVIILLLFLSLQLYYIKTEKEK